jgi:hypothetical protein
MLRRFLACAITACSLMLLTGCFVDSIQTTASIQKNNQTGATTTSVGVSVTVKGLGSQIALWMPPVSGTDLASLDPSQAIMNYSLSNATIASTGGPLTITLTDANTASTIGQGTFQYVVRNQSLYAQDPSAVSAWLGQFTAYSNINVTVNANTDVQPVSQGTVTVTNNAQYQGTTYASASTSWQANLNCGTGTLSHLCPVQ